VKDKSYHPAYYCIWT